MIGWRFALSRKWAGYLSLTVVVAIVCCLLGMWQFARRAEARVEIDRVAQNYDSAPRALGDVLPTVDAYDGDDKWLPVIATGEYIIEEQLLVRNRPFDGNIGFEVLTPLRLDDGSYFIVDRGWVPSGSTPGATVVAPAPPTGVVTVVARLKPSEATIANRSAPAGQIATIHLHDVASRLDAPTYTGAYGLLDSEDPAPAAVRPAGAAKPIPNEGPHLSYALQWFVFAIMAFAGLGWALREGYRVVNADDPDERDRADLRRRRRAAKAKSDAEVEDEILDALH